MSINQRKDKLWDVHKKEHCWVAKKYSKLWIYATRCMNITDIVNKVTYKSENVQFHLYEIQEQVQLVYVNRKQWKKWLPRAERERSFLHTLRWWKGSLSGLGLQRYTHLSKVIKCNPKINALHRPQILLEYRPFYLKICYFQKQVFTDMWTHFNLLSWPKSFFSFRRKNKTHFSFSPRTLLNNIFTIPFYYLLSFSRQLQNSIFPELIFLRKELFQITSTVFQRVKNFSIKRIL